MATETRYVSDDVWRQLPQRRLPRGRTTATLIAVLVIVAAIGIGQRIGLFKPGFDVGTTSWGAQQGSHRFSEGFMLTNTGWFTTTLSTIGVTAPWLHVTSMTIDSLNTHGERGPGNIITLKPGETVSYKLELTVPDCAAMDKAGSSVLVTAHGPLWTRTVAIKPPGTDDPSAPSLQTWTGPTNPYLIPWPLESARLACTPVASK